MNYIFNKEGVVFFLDGERFKLAKDSNQYLAVVKAFDLPETEQEAVVKEILSEKRGYVKRDGFHVTPNEVIYKEEKLPDVLAGKIRSLLADGLPIALFGKFWENLKQNPSFTAINELYDFLAYKELPITTDGYFIAYKGVNPSGWSKSGNKETVVLQGKVNDFGNIYNPVGDTIEVERRCVDDERSNGCSSGLHIGSLSYAKTWANRVVVVKVHPKDVVSVPSDCSFQKCRVCKYEIIDAFGEEIKAAATKEDGSKIEVIKDTTDEFDGRIREYLISQERLGFSEVPVQKVQNSFSPDYPSRERTLEALSRIGLIWHVEDGKPVVEL